MEPMTTQPVLTQPVPDQPVSAQPVSAQPVFEAHLPTDRLLTWEDLQSIPDTDHWAYELVEGELLVSPSPGLAHQAAVLGLAVVLRRGCPPEAIVVIAPFDYVPRPGYSLQPDVLVVDRAVVGSQRVTEPPLLAVEVLSPGSRVIDQSLKRLVYEEHGVPAYWIVDPQRPSLLVLELEDGRYVERAFVTGEQASDAAVPFPVHVVPAELVAG